MKKVFASLLALSMVVAFASCGGDSTVVSSTDASSTNSVASTPSTGASSEQAPISSEQVSEPSTPADENPWNLSFKGNPYVDSVSTEYPSYVAENLMDGDTTSESRWQSASTGNTAEDGTVNPAWCGIVWEEAQTFDKVVIVWETAHPTEDGVVLQVSDDGETWTDVEVTFERTKKEGEEDNYHTDTFTFEALTAKYVRAYCTKSYVTASGDVKEHPSCYEFEVYNTADMEADAETDEEASEEAAE